MGVARIVEKIWKNRDICNETKVMLRRSLVRSVLLYSAETWTLKEENKGTLRVLEMSVFRKILGCTRRDHIYDAEILNTSGIDEDFV